MELQPSTAAFIAHAIDWFVHFKRFRGDTITGGAKDARFSRDFFSFCGLLSGIALNTRKTVKFNEYHEHK